MVVLVLRQKGTYQVPREVKVASELGLASASFTWTVVELWTLPADELLAVPDVGLVPWVPLAHFEGEPAPLLRRCRERIEREGGREQPNLLAVTQVLARLRFPHAGLLDLLGGRQAMIESPLLEEFEAEVQQRTFHQNILSLLTDRFETVPADLEARLRGVVAQESLNQLLRLSARCASLEEFAAAIPAAAPARSTRGRRRKQ